MLEEEQILAEELIPSFVDDLTTSEHLLQTRLRELVARQMEARIKRGGDPNSCGTDDDWKATEAATLYNLLLVISAHLQRMTAKIAFLELQSAESHEVCNEKIKRLKGVLQPSLLIDQLSTSTSIAPTIQQSQTGYRNRIWQDFSSQHAHGVEKSAEHASHFQTFKDTDSWSIGVQEIEASLIRTSAYGNASRWDWNTIRQAFSDRQREKQYLLSMKDNMEKKLQTLQAELSDKVKVIEELQQRKNEVDDQLALVDVQLEHPNTPMPSLPASVVSSAYSETSMAWLPSRNDTPPTLQRILMFKQRARELDLKSEELQQQINAQRRSRAVLLEEISQLQEMVSKTVEKMGEITSSIPLAPPTPTKPLTTAHQPLTSAHQPHVATDPRIQPQPEPLKFMVRSTSLKETSNGLQYPPQILQAGPVKTTLGMPVWPSHPYGHQQPHQQRFAIAAPQSYPGLIAVPDPKVPGGFVYRKAE
eukprot:TRINITY_DN2529_c0_g1_i3.p1 TRINITY_DN2529_c0_g1~~TRINITY_DN2529_c0_g1_i3.p1  ORF type:complete len:475 (+),score=92.84 TRINITY_DN2529_c0_g1_i3:64-1488(+)